MAGFSIDDPYYLLLTLCCLAIVVALLAAKYRENDFLPEILVAFELGVFTVFLWNSVVPSDIQLENPLYFAIGVIGGTAIVFAIWHTGSGIVIAILMGMLTFALLISGRDKVSSAFGGLSYYWLAGIFVAVVLVALLLWRCLRRWTSLWGFIAVLFIGAGSGHGRRHRAPRDRHGQLWARHL